jgi:hypothetical protein
VLIYAGLFHFADHLLLTARCFSAVCAAAAVTLIFVTALQSLSFLRPRPRLLWSLGFGLFFLANPLFTYTAGMAWNHDFALLCCLAGFLSLSRGLDAASRWSLGWVALAGMLLGLAFTTRLTFAPVALPFGLFVLLRPGIAPKRRGVLLAVLLGGAVISTLPSVAALPAVPLRGHAVHAAGCRAGRGAGA